MGAAERSPLAEGRELKLLKRYTKVTLGKGRPSRRGVN